MSKSPFWRFSAGPKPLRREKFPEKPTSKADGYGIMRAKGVNGLKSPKMAIFGQFRLFYEKSK